MVEPATSFHAKGKHKMDLTKMLKIAFMAAIIFPLIISQLSGVDTSGWNATVVTIWDNLPVFAGLALLFGFLKFTETGKKIRF